MSLEKLIINNKCYLDRSKEGVDEIWAEGLSKPQMINFQI